MRNLTFANKDFAAIWQQNAETKEALNRMAYLRIKKLRLKPERKKHGLSINSDNFRQTRDDNGVAITTHNFAMADIQRYIQNADVVKDQNGVQTEESVLACDNVCRIYLLTKQG